MGFDKTTLKNIIFRRSDMGSNKICWPWFFSWNKKYIREIALKIDKVNDSIFIETLYI